MPEGPSILVMPPGDVVPNGAPHPRGAGSGAVLQEAVAAELDALSFEVSVVEADAATDHATAASDEAGLAAARERGADYCLLLSLGEFRDAAPMTFRTDYVTLERGVLLESESGTEVWRLEEPFRTEQTNLVVYTVMVRKVGRAVARSVAASDREPVKPSQEAPQPRLSGTLGPAPGGAGAHRLGVHPRLRARDGRFLVRLPGDVGAPSPRGAPRSRAAPGRRRGSGSGVRNSGCRLRSED